jgi:hypothetical protein
MPDTTTLEPIVVVPALWTNVPQKFVMNKLSAKSLPPPTVTVPLRTSMKEERVAFVMNTLPALIATVPVAFVLQLPTVRSAKAVNEPPAIVNAPDAGGPEAISALPKTAAPFDMMIAPVP